MDWSERAQLDVIHRPFWMSNNIQSVGQPTMELLTLP